jgi:hypothetical protein
MCRGENHKWRKVVLQRMSKGKIETESPKKGKKDFMILLMHNLNKKLSIPQAFCQVIILPR